MTRRPLPSAWTSAPTPGKLTLDLRFGDHLGAEGSLTLKILNSSGTQIERTILTPAEYSCQAPQLCPVRGGRDLLRFARHLSLPVARSVVHVEDHRDSDGFGDGSPTARRRRQM